jgi:hypothetical protein
LYWLSARGATEAQLGTGTYPVRVVPASRSLEFTLLTLSNQTTGILAVTLTGSAAFSSASSYAWTAGYVTGQPGTTALTITSQLANSFTIKGDNNAGVQFICVGS